MDICCYCKQYEFRNVNSVKIGEQEFRNGTWSVVSLNPFDPSLLVAKTWNVPNDGCSTYVVNVRIKFCPMCGREFKFDNLCDKCIFEFAECGSKKLEFGNSLTEDNVIKCIKIKPK